jgi:hypothetical protein
MPASLSPLVNQSPFTIKYFLVLGVLFGVALLPATALAGQSITIDGSSGSGGMVIGDVYGNGDPPDGALPGGGTDDLLDPNNNIVTVSDGGTVDGAVYGGYANTSGSATANNNTVIISNGDTIYGTMFSGVVYGGSAETASGSATANNNTVTISNGDTGLGVAGGSAETASGSATANNNTVTISNGTVSVGFIGGDASTLSGSATANNNTVTISNGTVGGCSGGSSGSTITEASDHITANDNTVIVNSGGRVSGKTSGGVATGAGPATATGNTVTINSGGMADYTVYGGHAFGFDSATATGNGVTISGGTVYGGVIGGYADRFSAFATANNNIVTVSDGGTVNGTVDDGSGDLYTDGTVYGGYANTYGSATANNNTVTISNGGAIYGTMFSGVVYGGSAVSVTSVSPSGSATANNNTVIISNGTVGDVYGGYTLSARDSVMDPSDNGSATANNNTVIISNGTVRYVYGGDASTLYNIFSASSGSATASYNTVTVSGGMVIGAVYGGATTSNSGSATASYNTVTVSGGTVTGAVYGGYAETLSGSATATGNSVTVSGSPDLTTAWFCGGGIGTGDGDAFTGNTLNLKTAGLTVGGLSNFEKLNFYLPPTLAAGGTMLTVTTAQLSENADGTGRQAVVNVGIDGASSPLAVGHQVVLIDASQGTLTGTPKNTTANGEGMQGVTLKYEFDITTEANQLLVKVAKINVNEETKALSEGFIGGLSLVTQGGDLAAGSGLANAVSAAQGGGYNSAGFGAVSGGSLRYNTGSHVDASGVSLMTGLAWGREVTPGRLTLGAFFEYGNGSYDTYNSFSDTAIHGDGDTYHLGGGVLDRLDFTDTGPGHVYAESSLRAGSVHNKYHSSDLGSDYDSSSAYYGLHLGTGYIWNVTEKTSLDLYGKYFWTRQGGDSVTLTTGDPVQFKAVNSHRLRAGARLSHAVNEHVSPYVGAAWEHEFDGQAKATTNGFDIPAPSLKGNTGIGEAGLSFTPSKDSPLSLDLGVQGYTGKREGVTGSLQVRFNF